MTPPAGIIYHVPGPDGPGGYIRRAESFAGPVWYAFNFRAGSGVETQCHTLLEAINAACCTRNERRRAKAALGLK